MYTDEEKNDKSAQYKSYIDEHIDNFNMARRLYLFDIVEFLQNLSESNSIEGLFCTRTMGIQVGLIKHDASKYSVEEFEGYRQYFYPIDDMEKNIDVFNDAWKHHYSNNRHHWEYWLSANLADRILRDGKVHRKDIRSDEDVFDMHLISLIEMVLDWIAMGIKFNNPPRDFYNKNNMWE